ncbi:MAG: acyl-ACP--UDP-N-acetylglucosamine O-acyltransferase [Planctomycetota bacterium]
MMNIHPTALVDPAADIAPDASIGPWTRIEAGARIGARTRVGPQVQVFSGAIIGEDNDIHTGALLGAPPQDLSYKNQPTGVRIGHRNTIREYATIHRSAKEGAVTTIGDDNFIMGLSHVAHDCRIGNRVVLANGALLAGHVEVADRAFISGNVVIHQFVRIGTLAMIAGLVRVGKDVPPYTIIEGDSVVKGLNVVGIRRAGFSPEQRDRIKQAYKTLFLSGRNVTQALADLAPLDMNDEIRTLTDFIRNSKRGICRHAGGEEVSGSILEGA